MIVLPKRVYEHALDLSPDRLPMRVYDLDRLHDHAGRLRAALPSFVELHIALPPGADTDMIAALVPHVSGFEVPTGSPVVSGGAVHVPLTLTGTAKSGDDIAAAVAHRDAGVAVESPEELRLVAHAARRAGRPVDVLLRVDLPLGTRSEEPAGPGAPEAPAISGMDAASLVACAEVVRGEALVRPAGFAARLPAAASAAEAGDLAASLVRTLRPWSAMFGIDGAHYAVAGGRLSGPEDPDPYDWAGYGARLARIVRPGETVRVVPDGTPESWAGWLLTEVLDVRHNHGRAVAVLAAGGLADAPDRGPAVVARDDAAAWGRPWRRPELRDEPVTLIGRGPHGAVLALDVPLTRIRPGDVVVFPLG